MHRRGRPPTRRTAARAPAPKEEHVDESVNVPTPSPPPQLAVLECGPVDAVQMAQMLAAALHQLDPERALSWLESNEEIYQVMGCTEEQMVTYSALLLKDRTKDWWKALQRRHPEGVSWADFKREFLEKFYPKSYRDAGVEEFFRLEQSNNEEEKANRFAVGLNPKIRAYVVSAAHTQYGALVEAATRVERSMAAIPRPRPQKWSWSGSSQGGSSKSARTRGQSTWSGSQRSSVGPQSSQASVMPATGSRGTTENMKTKPLCSRCGRNHTGECRQGIIGCFRCGQEGHLMKDCPQAEPASTSEPENRSTATWQTSGGRGQHRGGFQFIGPSSSG
ncbi:hypothetical protein JRO89_XS02G0197900 [Xanthoceras sorbifolium]|uniref:CCHC-type domain-containing protein n=1 Tax=Xanthoceras sorbifolium TaxID=99658 RepID=A0ABQ8IG94_9ROSI|nr:hypothetical protein JRO89_XS02G0197900 [Xanthoceras sorbifolium]